MSVREDQLEPLDVMDSVLDESELAEALAAVRNRLQVIEARLEQLEQAGVRARKEEHLLEGLIALRRGDDLESNGDPPLQVPKKNGEVHADVVESTIALLRDEHRPMHISELMAALQEKQVRIPGSGQQANLISYLRRDGRIVRPSRGIYGLGEWGLKDATTPSRKRKRTKRSKTTKRS
jgi:hypothetical protein